MCDCKKTDGFKQKLAEAKKLTEETGETHVVYTKEVPGQGKHIFLRKETDLNDELGVCCYYLSDGTEVEYTLEVSKEIKTKAKKQSKIDAKNQTAKSENIDVVENETSPEEEG